MTTKQKRAAALCTTVLALFLFGYWLFPKDRGESEYIFDKSYDIKTTDVHKSREHIDFDNPDKTAEPPPDKSSAPEKNDSDAIKSPNQDGVDLRALFSEGLINSYTTLKFFKHLEHKFRASATLGEHFDSVEQYLFSEFSEKEARKLFDTYKEYLQCEMDLVEMYKNFADVQSPAEAIEMLKQIQEFRRDRLGKELADKLFGTDVKAKEYAFRRAAIVRDEALYGKEKEKQLAELNDAMWGEESAMVDAHRNDYNRYQETLQIYEKDLKTAESGKMRKAKLRELREKHFSPEVVAKFEDIDQQMAEDEKREENYRKQVEAIRSNAELTEKEKKTKIQDLRDEVFGEEAEAFRRREAIRKGREKLETELPLAAENLPEAGQK